MTTDDSKLDNLFQSYRRACDEPEPSANFMPGVWRRIESRRSIRFIFPQLARPLMAGSAALIVLLLILNLFSGPQARLSDPSYVDALMADHTAEKTYYTEALRGPIPATNQH